MITSENPCINSENIQEQNIKFNSMGYHIRIFRDQTWFVSSILWLCIILVFVLKEIWVGLILPNYLVFSFPWINYWIIICLENFICYYLLLILSDQIKSLMRTPSVGGFCIHSFCRNKVSYLWQNNYFPYLFLLPI